MLKHNINPIIKLDYPDPDIIRVDDVYYMVSTTMYFMPGCEILRSYDLMHWEHAAYVYERLDSTNAQCLEGKENIYGQGMWAASLRYHKGTFYVCFVANDTHKTYLYTSKDINGPWRKSEIPGFYHDNSILFDDDDRIFIVSGNREIHITELSYSEDDAYSDSSNILVPKEGGLNQIILKDADDAPLGYEGAHFYKIDGKYYLFVISIPKNIGKRTESCFVADRPEGPYVGKEVMYDDRGFRGSGVAQGGIVGTESGKWYSILFQDSGAVGRIPVLIPISWKKVNPASLSSGIITEKNPYDQNAPEVNFPVFGNDGKIPEEFDVEDLRPGYVYDPLVKSDYFFDEDGFKSCWQFNHEPDLHLIEKDPDKGTVRITTDKLCDNLVQAKNILTQRTLFPKCECNVHIDASEINEGDFAGLCVLESNYAFIGITKKSNEYYLTMCNREITTGGFWGERHDTEAATEIESIKINSPVITLHSAVSFDKDVASFYYSYGDDQPIQLGTSHNLQFKLDHFTGARFGLFIFSTKTIGGNAVFSKFNYLD